MTRNAAQRRSWTFYEAIKLVIVNSTLIISLSSVSHEFILQVLFQHIVIPKAVDIELRALEKPGSDFSDSDWVEVSSVQNKDLVQFLEKDLDRGESKVIVLAKELKADVVIIDENIGYQIAKHFDLPVMQTLSILKTAKARGVIGEVSPILDKMIQKGRWYSKEVVEIFLNSIGEL